VTRANIPDYLALAGPPDFSSGRRSNFLWQVRHHFITYDFLRFIHQRDVAEGLTSTFLPDQLEMTFSLFVWIAGCFLPAHAPNPLPARARWTFLVTLLLFVIANGRGYYWPRRIRCFTQPAQSGRALAFHSDSPRAQAVRVAVTAALALSILGAMAVACRSLR